MGKIDGEKSMHISGIDINICIGDKKRSAISVLLGAYFFVHFFSVITEYDFLALELIFLILFILCVKRIRLPELLIFPMVAILGMRYFSSHSDVQGYYAPIYHVVKYLRVLHLPFLIELFDEISENEKKRLLNICVIGIVLTDLISISYTFQHPLAIRYKENLGEGTFHGIIQFTQIFSFSIVNTFFFVRLMNKSNTVKERILTIAVIIVNTVMIIKAQLMTPVIMMFLCLVIYYSLMTKRTTKVLVGIPIVILLLVVYKPLLSSVLEFVGRLDSSIMTRRVEAIINTLLHTGGQVNSLSARQAKINISLDSFKLNPLFGIGFSTFDIDTIGCHQDWFDTLAVSGLLFYIFVIAYFVYLFFSAQRKTFDSACKNMLTAAFISFIVLGFLDPCLDSNIFIVIFLIAPNFEMICKSTSSKLTINH